MRMWHRLVGERPIIFRLVLTVAVAMTLVLTAGSAFVFWRVDLGLSRQLDRDLTAYRELAESAIENGRTLVSDTPGQQYQIYLPSGAVVGSTASGRTRLIPTSVVREAARSGTVVGDVGHMFGAPNRPYRYIAEPIETPDGRRVAVFAISRSDRDEALRELLLQLALVGIVTLVASSYVGYRTARGALDPVERFRNAAVSAGERDRIPVGERDDELSRLGTTFNALLDRVWASSDRERRFISDAAHELRSPLAVMRADAEWALLRARAADQQDPRGIESLDSIRSQVDRLAALCNMLLQLEELRVTPGDQHDFVDPEVALEEIATQWRERIRADGRDITTQSAALPVRVDPHWLHVALDNLVSNAVRYGRGTVALNAQEHDDRVVFSVTDEGPGFPDNFVDRAFDRFARADDSRASGGTGLGLSIVAAVADVYGGEVRIAGSTVSLELPRGVTPTGGTDAATRSG